MKLKGTIEIDTEQEEAIRKEVREECIKNLTPDSFTFEEMVSALRTYSDHSLGYINLIRESIPYIIAEMGKLDPNTTPFYETELKRYNALIAVRTILEML